MAISDDIVLFSPNWRKVKVEKPQLFGKQGFRLISECLLHRMHSLVSSLTSLD